MHGHHQLRLGHFWNETSKHERLGMRINTFHDRLALSPVITGKEGKK